MITDEPFRAFGLSHGVATVTIASLAYYLLRRVQKTPTNSFITTRYVLAGLLLYSVFSGVINALLRYSNEVAWNKILVTELPFFLCDVVGLVLALALIWKNQRLTEVGYVWAMAGTVQGLITPMLMYDWPSLEYFSFFIQHGIAPIAAVLLVWGFKLRPHAGAYQRVWAWTWGYVVIVLGVNFLLDTNYGFLSKKPEGETALDLLGPYPWYLLSMHAIAAVLYLFLLLPFKRDGQQLK